MRFKCKHEARHQGQHYIHRTAACVSHHFLFWSRARSLSLPRSRTEPLSAAQVDACVMPGLASLELREVQWTYCRISLHHRKFLEPILRTYMFFSTLPEGEPPASTVTTKNSHRVTPDRLCPPYSLPPYPVSSCDTLHYPLWVGALRPAWK